MTDKLSPRPIIILEPHPDPYEEASLDAFIRLLVKVAREIAAQDQEAAREKEGEAIEGE